MRKGVFVSVMWAIVWSCSLNYGAQAIGYNLSAWSDPKEVALPSIGGSGRLAVVQSQAKLSTEDVGERNVERLYSPKSGAAWIGVSYEKYAAISGKIVGFKVQARSVRCKFSKFTLGDSGELDAVTDRALSSMPTDATEHLEDDLRIDLGKIFGLASLTGGDTRPFGNIASIEAIESDGTNLVMLMKSVRGSKLKLVLDPKLVPTSATQGNKNVILLEDGTSNPKNEQKPKWSSPNKALLNSANHRFGNFTHLHCLPILNPCDRDEETSFSRDERRRRFLRRRRFA